MRRMGKRELAAKYGKNKNTPNLMNAAIRAECPGGNEALAALDRLRALAAASGTEDAQAGLAAVRSIVDAMAAEIRRRYDMPARDA